MGIIIQYILVVGIFFLAGWGLYRHFRESFSLKDCNTDCGCTPKEHKKDAHS